MGGGGKECRRAGREARVRDHPTMARRDAPGEQGDGLTREGGSPSRWSAIHDGAGGDRRPRPHLYPAISSLACVRRCWRTAAALAAAAASKELPAWPYYKLQKGAAVLAGSSDAAAISGDSSTDVELRL